MIQTEQGRNFTIDAHEILHNRSSYYASRDSGESEGEEFDKEYKAEYESFVDEEYEITDWLLNNMDWYECNTLKELPQEKVDVSELDIDDYHVFTPKEVDGD